MLAVFADAGAQRRAEAALRQAGISDVARHLPAEPREGMERSAIPLIVLVCGLLGAAAGFAMQVYATVWSYPQNIGGRPLFSWPSYIPIAFELGVLAAVAGGFVAFLIAAGLPLLYSPEDRSDLMRAATRDGYVLVLRPGDRNLAWRVLRRQDPVMIEELPEGAARVSHRVHP
ncbi:DUF3341 domain-containing protein [Rhodopila sp.]|jgi:hypothetical protein|uniref:DUF3341 domain-containing protein n=1 Tax=Rhodopila sp. TaxID=2480087 RepID=UPI002C1D7359|nr:DUF3341 domain-containing protein [Rhodopila sp.]HVZ10293.1 DUF3341 domain-containing protein [Rhodopila sp.]